MKIHSIRLTIQDVESSDNVPLVGLFVDVFVDNGKVMTDEENNPKLTPEGLPQPDFDIVKSVDLLSRHPSLKKTLQTLAIQTLTLQAIEDAHAEGKELEIEGLGLENTPTRKGFRTPSTKKRVTKRKK